MKTVADKREGGSSRLAQRMRSIGFGLGVALTLSVAVGQQTRIDVDSNGIPRFVQTDYIELAKIDRISRFRSGEGHDYSDNFESCRSMKHYSYFDVMTDALFATYNARGINLRADAIISKAARDADPLTCEDETFDGPGHLPNWVQLQ